MNELNQNIEIKIGSNKNFGYFFSVIFLAIAIFPLFFGNNLRIWALIIFLILFLISILKPSLLKHPNLIWVKFGFFLSKIFSPVILALVYLLGVLPVGLYFRLSKKDLLKTKFDNSLETYWIKKEKMQSMKRQF